MYNFLTFESQFSIIKHRSQDRIVVKQVSYGLGNGEIFPIPGVGLRLLSPPKCPEALGPNQSLD
jgi:hypothetical protein